MSSACRSRFFLLAALAFTPGTAGAWGSGHDDIVRAVIERLPDEVRAGFTPEIIKHATAHSSHYPDSFEPFDPAEVGESAVAALNEAGLKVRYDLHHDHGRVASFARLVDAFHEGNPEPIAHWIASHSHVIADMAACNHDPLVHNATYGWAPWKVKLPHGGDFSQVSRFLDLSGTVRDNAGGTAAFHEAIDRLLLTDDGRTAEDQVVEMILYGQEGARFCSPRGVEVLRGAAGWIDREDPEARTVLWRNLGELGAWAVVRTLRDIAVARRFADAGIEVALDDSAKTRADEAIDTLLRERKIEEDALYAPILRSLSPQDRGVTGVVLEPTWDMNDAMLGFSSRVQSAAIVRTLSKRGHGHATLDLRELLDQGFPKVGQVPLVIIVATSFNNYRWMKTATFDDRLSDYVAAGGRVLWIAGTGQLPKRTFAEMIPLMTREAQAKLPVPPDAFTSARLSASLKEERGWNIANTPETPAGWQRPHCPWRFDSPAPDFETILTLEAGSSRHTVGVVARNRRLALLPVYAVTPHLLDKETPVASPHEPELDAPSEAILMGTLERLLSPE